MDALPPALLCACVTTEAREYGGGQDTIAVQRGGRELTLSEPLPTL